jgi:hypothetical protein
MRLYFLSGDRTQALRQYEMCAAALVEELGVAPSKPTVELYERIRADDHHPASAHARIVSPPEPEALSGRLKDTLGRLEALSDELDTVRLQVQQEISSIKEIIQLT